MFACMFIALPFRIRIRVGICLLNMTRRISPLNNKHVHLLLKTTDRGLPLTLQVPDPPVSRVGIFCAPPRDATHSAPKERQPPDPYTTKGRAPGKPLLPAITLFHGRGFRGAVA
jgi:hypothetical protein